MMSPYAEAIACAALTVAVLRLMWWVFFEPDADGRVARVLTGLDALDRSQMVKDPPKMPDKARPHVLHLPEHRLN